MTIDISQSFETIEEASLYFRDASMENPQRRRAIFPTVSSPSAVVPPSTTKGTADVFDRSSVSYGAPVRSSQQEREQDLRPMRLEFWDDERLFDESSCGSLDYSLDDDGEEDTQAGVSSQKQALIVWDLDVYYVFPRPRSEETKYHKCCFELPLSRWITSLFCNHHGR